MKRGIVLLLKLLLNTAIELQDVNDTHKNIIISGGGTGGHIFPAIAIAQALRKKRPEINILFVGASGKMEMEKVPAAGYEIIGLPVTGLKRKLTFKNVSVVINLLRSLLKAKRIIKEFKPDAVVGVGGYASGPVLNIAARKNIPTLIQEQNSYAGITNKILAKKADRICVAYEGMERFFPESKIVFTGNPVRDDLENMNGKQKVGLDHFELNPDFPVILILGGSLGAKTINESVWNHLELISDSTTQIIWQTGKLYYQRALEKIEGLHLPNLKVFEFIHDMDLAFATAQLVISRAGAGTISELCIVGKPAILVPSPNVAEDHQTKNAEALVRNGAAIIVKDKDAEGGLIKESLKVVENKELLSELSINIGKMAMNNSASTIAEEILKLIA